MKKIILISQPTGIYCLGWLAYLSEKTGTKPMTDCPLKLITRKWTASPESTRHHSLQAKKNFSASSFCNEDIQGHITMFLWRQLKETLQASKPANGFTTSMWERPIKTWIPFFPERHAISPYPASSLQLCASKQGKEKPPEVSTCVKGENIILPGPGATRHNQHTACETFQCF